MTKRRLKISLLSLFIFFLMGVIIFNPNKYMHSINDGFSLFLFKFAPFAFPFFFLSKLLICILPYDRASMFSKMFKKIYNCSDISFTIFIISILSGYPTNAKYIQDFYLDKKIDHNECKKLCSFTSNSRPIFIIGTVGCIFLENVLFGYILYVTHILSSLLNGLIYRNIKGDYTSNAIYVRGAVSLLDIMLDCIKSLFIVGGFITMFYLLIDVLYSFNIFNILNYVLKIFFNEEQSNILSYSFFELSYGMSFITTKNKSILPVVAGCISFGGLSIAMQSYAFLSKCKISLAYYILTKSTQSLISVILTYFAIALF